MKFIEPPYTNVENRRYKDHENWVINLSMVRLISKRQVKYYPDNEGIPSIEFIFNDARTHNWIFNNEDERDDMYNKILKGIT